MDFSKWTFSKMDFSKKNMNFFKTELFKNGFFIFKILICWPQKSQIVPRPEFCPARRHEKKGVVYFGNLLFGAWYAALYLHS
jgi:hypothetical protein